MTHESGQLGSKAVGREFSDLDLIDSGRQCLKSAHLSMGERVLTERGKYLSLLYQQVAVFDLDY